MFDLSSRYGWWKTHAGWAERRDWAISTRNEMIERYRKAQADNRQALRVASRRSAFDRRMALRESLTISDTYSTRAQREAAPTATRASFTDYRELVAQYMRETSDLQDAHSQLMELESLLADLAFESDHTASDYIDERPDDEIEEEREALSLYAEALEDVSAHAFDIAMEDRIYGRPSGLTSFIREAVRDGWACVPDYTDAIDNPVMVASDRGLLTALDAMDHQPVYRRMRDREAAAAFRHVQTHRRWIEGILLDLDEEDEQAPAAPVFECNADDVPRLRQGWLVAREANDTESMAHFERVGKLAAPVYRERQAMRAEVERVSLHC